MDNERYVIVRTYSAGCFAGVIESQSADGKLVRLREARRLWYWAGAASLSGLAARGTSRPTDCKFPGPVTVTLTEAIEIIDVTMDARASIEAVPEWIA